MKSIILLLLMVACAAQGHAQLRSQAEKKPIDVVGGITSPLSGSFLGLFSPDRFVMNHSYSMTYFSGGGMSGSMGVYMNTMNFKLSNPLYLRVNMGVEHQPFGGKRIYGNEGAHFLHGAELIYQPNQNFQMQVGYSNNPFYGGYGYQPNPFYRPGPAGNPFYDAANGRP